MYQRPAVDKNDNILELGYRSGKKCRGRSINLSDTNPSEKKNIFLYFSVNANPALSDRIYPKKFYPAASHI
jgi:hypothetical protein